MADVRGLQAGAGGADVPASLEDVTTWGSAEVVGTRSQVSAWVLLGPSSQGPWRTELVSEAGGCPGVLQGQETRRCSREREPQGLAGGWA